jgi:hypothetical protein
MTNEELRDNIEQLQQDISIQKAWNESQEKCKNRFFTWICSISVVAIGSIYNVWHDYNSHQNNTDTQQTTKLENITERLAKCGC